MMDKQYYSLDVNRSNKVTRIFQLVFGALCFVVAVAWLIINMNTVQMTGSVWVTIIFLIVFAYFQVNSGLGRSAKFIELGESTLKLKKNSLLPVRYMNASDIEKIEIFPVNIVFFLKTGKKLNLRFGTTYTDIIEPAKKAIECFCRNNNLKYEFMNETL